MRHCAYLVTMQCLPQTWLLCVEFQLVLLMAPIVYYLNKSYTANFNTTNNQAAYRKFSAIKSPKRLHRGSNRALYWLQTTPGFLLLISILFGSAISFYNVYYKELPPSWLYTMVDPDSKTVYFSEHLTKAWTHLAVFALGLLAGVECRRASKSVICAYKGNSSQGSNAHGSDSSSVDIQTNITAPSTGLHQLAAGKSYSASSLPMISTNKAAHNPTKGLETVWHSNVSIDMSSNNSANTAGSVEDLNNRHNVHNHNHSHNHSHNHKHHHHNLYAASKNNYDALLKNNDYNNMTNSRRRSSTWLLIDIIISLVAITTMALILFSTYDWSVSELPNPYVAGLFDSGSRFLWSLGMIWILYMISVPNKDGNFSLLAKSLGHPFMVCLGKLSFLIYILHPFVHMAMLAIQEQPIYSNWFLLFHMMIGNITITVILASLVSLFVEMPCRNLFRRCGTSLLLTQTERGIILDNSSITTNTSAAPASGATTFGSRHDD